MHKHTYALHTYILTYSHRHFHIEVMCANFHHIHLFCEMDNHKHRFLGVCWKKGNLSSGTNTTKTQTFQSGGGP